MAGAPEGQEQDREGCGEVQGTGFGFKETRVLAPSLTISVTWEKSLNLSGLPFPYL